MVQDFVTVRLMSYQFGWLIQKLNMEEDKLSLHPFTPGEHMV